MWADIDLEGLCAIFEFTRLSDLRKHCRKLIVHGSDLATLIMAANVSDDFCHMPIFKHHHPEHLALSDDDLGALGSAKAGEKPNDPALKTMRKIDQMFTERRMFCGHLFWLVGDRDRLPNAWHLLHFDDKSTSENRNHWQHGSHVHLMNHLTHPNLPLKKLLDQLDSEERPWLGGGLHIRYSR